MGKSVSYGDGWVDGGRYLIFTRDLKIFENDSQENRKRKFETGIVD